MPGVGEAGGGGGAVGAPNLETLRCPGCSRLPFNKVFQCAAGHFLCEQCYSSTPTCTPCGGTPFPMRIRNTGLEAVLDSLELECVYKGNGCGVKLGRREIGRHNRTCEFRDSAPLCGQMGLKCAFKISRDGIAAAVNHFRENHQFIEVPAAGSPISLHLQDFRVSVASNELSTTTTVWPPILVKLVMGPEHALYSVLLLRANPSEKYLSVGAIGLSDLFPVQGVEADTQQLRVQFSIKTDAGGLPPLSWNVSPFPAMNCKELLSSQPYRIPIPLLLSRYMGAAARGLKIECEIKPCSSGIRGPSDNVLSMALERVPGDQVEVGQQQQQQQQPEQRRAFLGGLFREELEFFGRRNRNAAPYPPRRNRMPEQRMPNLQVEREAIIPQLRRRLVGPGYVFARRRYQGQDFWNQRIPPGGPEAGVGPRRLADGEPPGSPPRQADVPMHDPSSP